MVNENKMQRISNTLQLAYNEHERTDEFGSQHPKTGICEL